VSGRPPAALLVLLLVVTGHPRDARPAGDAATPGGCDLEEVAAYAAAAYATADGMALRCELWQRIRSAADVLPPVLHERMKRESTKRFTTVLDFQGRVDVSRPVVDYLLENVSRTAVLVSAYSERRYSATQLESGRSARRFTVTDGERFAAGFSYLWTRMSAAASEHMFFETGRARVLWWTIWGNAFVHYRLEKEDDRSSRYDIRIRVFTESRVLRAILGSRLFRHFAGRMFDGILEDIEHAVRAFEGDPRPPAGLPARYRAGLLERLRHRDRPLGAR